MKHKVYISFIGDRINEMFVLNSAAKKINNIRPLNSYILVTLHFTCKILVWKFFSLHVYMFLVVFIVFYVYVQIILISGIISGII